MIKNYLFQLLYKSTVQENDRLKAENEMLRKELLAKGNIFYREHKWLGRDKVVFGTVIDGKTIALQELSRDDHLSFDKPKK